MDTADYLLVCLAEEAAEIQQLVCKALRFGLSDSHPSEDVVGTNEDRLVQEIDDFFGVLLMLREHGVLTNLDLPAPNSAMLQKKEKVLRFMRYSQAMGKLTAEKKVET